MMNTRNNSDTKLMGTGLSAALVASLCCVTPVFAFLSGIGGIASAFSWVEPFRPYLIGLTALLLGFAWYQKLKSQWDPECDCDENPSFWQSKGFLGLVTILAILLLAFPYYSDAFFANQQNQEVEYAQASLQTITLGIEGITCTGCEAIVEHTVRNLDGVIEANAFYNTGSATIKFDQSQIQQNDIETAIHETGFTVVSSRDGEPSSDNLSSSSNSNDFCPLHGDGDCSGSCQVRSSCTIEHLDQTLAQSVDKNITVNVIRINDRYEALKKSFNEDIGHPRFVAVLSSVCRWCIDGAIKIKQSLLEQSESEKFRVHIIWMDMLEDDNYTSAQKAARLLHDPRVTHYYTSGKQFGREIANQITGKDGVAWDIYMFYDGTVRWENNFPKPTEYVHQLNPDYYNWVEKDKYYSGEELKDQLTDLTSKYKNKTQ